MIHRELFTPEHQACHVLRQLLKLGKRQHLLCTTVDEVEDDPHEDLGAFVLDILACLDEEGHNCVDGNTLWARDRRRDKQRKEGYIKSESVKISVQHAATARQQGNGDTRWQQSPQVQRCRGAGQESGAEEMAFT